MAPRPMCSSMCALRRHLVVDVSSIPRCSARAFRGSARSLEEQSDHAAPSAPAPDARKSRSATALRQITDLQTRRIAPGGLVRGVFLSGQSPASGTRSPATQIDGSSSAPEGAPTGAQSRANPRLARSATSPTHHQGGGPPSGQMVRAPSQLRITRGAVGGGVRAPNLRGPDLRGRDGTRARGPGGPRGGPKGSRDGAREPKKRERKQGGDSGPQATSVGDVDTATTLSDGMVHHLLRLQRKEWDRVPYEPKYAKGSFAANELIYAGREMFRGESPPVKVWGPLERRIGVVGMFGAEATLKVRRVGDGDSEPFGQEVEETMDSEGSAGQKMPVVQ